MSLKLTVKVLYRPEYFNRVAQATVPAHWVANVTDGLPDEYFQVRGVGNTRQEAIDNLVSDLKSENLQGTLKVI